MAATKHRRPPKPLLTLKVSGPEIRPGRIPVPDLLAICQHAQAAVNRQAEALEGRRSLRPGPKIGKVVDECTLELVSIGKGSATLGLEPAKAQAHLPQFTGLGDEAIVAVATAISHLSKGRKSSIDPGVLDSLRNMGAVFDDGVKSVQWIVRAGPGRKRIAATFDRRVRARASEHLKVPTTRSIAIDGVLEMADFKPADFRCRIHPAVGGAISCTFDAALADDVYRVLRQPAHIEGTAAENALTGRLESLHLRTVSPLDPLSADAGSFVRGWSLDQLARLQGVDPLRDPSVLAGGWPDDDDVDETLAEIYRQRD